MHAKILVSGVCFLVKGRIIHSFFFCPEFCFRNYWRREATSSGEKNQIVISCSTCLCGWCHYFLLCVFGHIMELFYM